jgi:hypothetical protein
MALLSVIAPTRCQLSNRQCLPHCFQALADKVAFALIKTEGLDEVSRTRITREAQAMGRLDSHPHIVA